MLRHQRKSNRYSADRYLLDKAAFGGPPQKERHRTTQLVTRHRGGGRGRGGGPATTPTATGSDAVGLSLPRITIALAMRRATASSSGTTTSSSGGISTYPHRQDTGLHPNGGGGISSSGHSSAPRGAGSRARMPCMTPSRTGRMASPSSSAPFPSRRAGLATTA